MRIALLVNSLPPRIRGGSQAYVAALAAGLADKHDVLVLSGAPPNSLPDVECVQLPHLEDPRRGASRATKSAWHLREQWLPAVHRAVLGELRRFRPDVVHTHQPQGLSAAVFSAIASADLPHVHTAHDYNLLCVRVTMNRNGSPCGGSCLACLLQRNVRARLARRHLHRMIAPSDFVRRVHVDAGVVPRERAVTIRQGALPGTARLRRIRPGAPTLGYLGAVSPHKGIPTLLEAFSRAPGGWRLRIAGDGSCADLVRRAAGVDGRITYLAEIGSSDKDRFLNSIDLLVIPSEWKENAPLVAVEAAVRGLPCLVSDLGGLPETPEAHLFRARDAAGLVAAATRLATSPELIERASARLLARRVEFLWSNHLRSVERELAEVVSG